MAQVNFVAILRNRRRFSATSRTTCTNSYFSEVSEVLDAIDFRELVAALDSYRWTGTRFIGRRGYSNRAMLRLFFAMFILNYQRDNDFLDLVNISPDLRKVCGFRDDVPSRSVFSRFRSRLAELRPLVNEIRIQITNQVKELLVEHNPDKPALGEVVAVDSTDVESYSNPNRKHGEDNHVSDPESTWGVRHNPRSPKGEMEPYFGMKAHVIADAIYELPLDYTVTPANVHDSKELEDLFVKTKEDFPWFAPKTLLADRGYDDQKIFKWLWKKKVDPVIRIRKPKAHDGLYDGIYTKRGAPVCLGNQEMKYIKTDPETGKHLFRCPPGGCSLKTRGTKAIRHCDTREWEDPADNPRALGGWTARASKAWKKLYNLRWAVERIFQSLKESRGLEGHLMRGKARLELLIGSSLLAYMATVLARLRRGDFKGMRKMKVRMA